LSESLNCLSGRGAMRYWYRVVALVLLVSACGSGAVSPGNTTDAQGDGSTKDVIGFASDDGIVSVEVPNGAAPDNFSGTVVKGDLSELGVDTSGSDNVVLVYELGPDGSVFDDPVTVTFRIPPALGGFDPSMGLPLTLVIIEDGNGGFEPLASTRSFLDGDVLVVEGTTSHFTTTFIEIGENQILLVVDPSGLTKSLESPFEVRLEESGPSLESASFGHIDYAAGYPLEVISSDFDEATVVCKEEGVGTITGQVYGHTYGGFLFDDDRVIAAMLVRDIDSFGQLDLKISCVKGADGSTTSTAPPEPRNVSNPWEVIDGRRLTPGAGVLAPEGDCFGTDGEVECIAGVDITGVKRDPVPGYPDLEAITIEFGTPIGNGNVDVNLTIFGDERTGVTRLISVANGEVTWDIPGSGVPVAGESVTLKANGHVVVVLLISVTGTERWKISVNQIGTNDAVEIRNIPPVE
jgi:hypothetical protein